MHTHSSPSTDIPVHLVDEPTASIVAPAEGSPAHEQSFRERVTADYNRRAASAERYWEHRSPTDTRTADRIRAGEDSDTLPVVATAVAAIGAGMGGGLALVVTPYPFLSAVPFMGGVVTMLATIFGEWKAPSRLSRRYREHEALMANAVYVPATVADAYDDVNAGASRLRLLSAPDMAIAYAVDAREQAADALVALAELTKVSRDAVWLATTDPYHRLLTLAAEVTVLQHLSKDRLALPRSTQSATAPEGLHTAEEVGAYLLTENQTVSRALAPTPATNGA